MSIINMHSELEKVTVEAQRDIEVLRNKIEKFYQGEIPEERFKAYRLTRGVYGQRQPGVQMIRIKIPYGKVTGEQLIRIAEVSDRFSNGNLHATTRQNIQLHHVSLDDSPQVWEELEQVGITLRESCGNTVRNITASAKAGIDPEEPFDVSPYAESVFQYFLRNPVCQDMGRKIKMAFSSNVKDSAYTYIHDFGFIPKVVNRQRGFKVVVGGGLGAQAMIAQTAYDFLPEKRLIPFLEAALRVFDRFGEREKRHKARLKYLVDHKTGIGVEELLKLIENEEAGLPYQEYAIDPENIPKADIPEAGRLKESYFVDEARYNLWLQTNVFEQKQSGFFGINVKLNLGNISASTARKLVSVIDGYVADDIRLTVNQGLQLKYIRPEYLPYLFTKLDDLGLARSGFGSTADITACPGTDTCNLAVTNSTGIAGELERLVRDEYPELLIDDEIKIKISGCMNSCGQHMIANIGFHGSSIKLGQKVIPALQVVIGGGVNRDGKGYIADKVIKLPTKRAPLALRVLIDDYLNCRNAEDSFNQYYTEKGKRYFYDLLKPLADLSSVEPHEYLDWGNEIQFVPEIGVGECAGISYDMVGSIIGDAEERINSAQEGLERGKWSDAIYNCYSTLIIGAKALLLTEEISCNTHRQIISDFDTHFVKTGRFELSHSFESLVLAMSKNEPTEIFARQYFAETQEFLKSVYQYRAESTVEDLITKNSYRA